MGDLTNFKTMLSHGFPINKIYEEIIDDRYTIIEKKMIKIHGLTEVIEYEQFIFDNNTEEFISRQFSTCSAVVNEEE